MEYRWIFDYDNLFRAAMSAMEENRFSHTKEDFCGKDGKLLGESLIILQNDLIWKTYQVIPCLRKGDGGETLTELSLRDRVVQIAVCNALRKDRKRPIRNRKILWLIKVMYDGGTWFANL